MVKDSVIKRESQLPTLFRSIAEFLKVGLRTGLITLPRAKLSRLSKRPTLFSTAVPAISTLPPVPASMSVPSFWIVRLVADNDPF
jgi:hypothetical protein